MKCRFASIIIPLIYIALVMGFVPQNHRNSRSHYHQLMQLQNQAGSGIDTTENPCNYFQDNSFEKSKNSRESQIDHINLFNITLNINIEKSSSIDKLWKKARKVLATMVLIPILLGGKYLYLLSYYRI
jgi:hypothetical protein